jgi:hypothetical protein
MLFTARRAHEALRNTKHFFKNAYSEGHKWARTIDGWAGVFRRGLAAAAPLLQDLGAGEALGAGVRGLQNYDTVRKQVMDVDESGRGHYSRIASAIK